MSRSIQWLVAAGAVGVLAVGGRIGWHDHTQVVKRQNAELALRHILPVRAYPFGHEYTGSSDGLHCQVIALALPFHTLGDPTVGATLTGTFALTYTGLRPPAMTFYTLGGLPWPTLPSARMPIVEQGNPPPVSSSPEPLPVTQVGPHQYLYGIVHWHHAQWPMTAQQTRREFRTAVLQIDLASGRIVNIALHPRVR